MKSQHEVFPNLTRNLDQSEEVEHMDVDLSMNSQDSSFHRRHAATPTPQQSNLKVYHISYDRNIKNEPTMSFWIKMLFLTSLLFGILCIIIQFSINCKNLDISLVNKILNEQLYGQSVAAKQIVETLEREHNNKLMIFYGGTGVGKTYAASLMFKDVWNCTNVYHYTMPSFKKTFSSSSLHGLGICQSAYMVVDDLTGDTDIRGQIRDVFRRSVDINANMTVILIYNSTPKETGFFTNIFSDNDESLLLKLKHSFSNINVQQVYIKFNSLTKEHLRKCIENVNGGKKITDKLFEELSRNFDVTSDGCKGVGSKMKFLNVKV